MNAKQVYQGVRVRVTVKEMLQRKREREDNKKKVKMVTQADFRLQDLCSLTYPARADPGAPLPLLHQHTEGSTTQSDLQELQVQVQVQSSFSSIHGPQFGDGFGFTSPAPSTLTPPTRPWSLTGSPPHRSPMAGYSSYSSYSSSYSPNPKDYYSSSPQDSSSSSSSSSCYSSPSRYPCTQEGYWEPEAWLSQQGYPPYDPPDYESACAMKELNNTDYWRGGAFSSELCYNRG